MAFGAKKPKTLETKKMAEIVRYAAERIPDGFEAPELGNITVAGGNHAYEAFLRRAYLGVESRILERRLAEFPDAISLRNHIQEHFHLERVVPSSFSVLFVPRSSQIFYLLRSLVEGIWDEAGWNMQKVPSVIGEAVSGTLLESLTEFSEEAWRIVFAHCLRLPEEQREKAIKDAFRRVNARTYYEIVKERGESRAKILFEAHARQLEREYGTIDAVASIPETLPEGILGEERVALASREELAETVRRQVQELRGKNIALAAEAGMLRETIRALERAKIELTAMASAQQDFITVVSHKFRTPLAAIRWQGDALQELAAKQSDKPELKDLADVVRERSIFLIGVLENIFDLLAIESGRFNLLWKRVSFNDVAEKLCAEFTQEAERRKRHMRCDSEADEPISIDANALRRVLSILFMNAIEYSNEGNTVEMQAVWREAAGGRREILVSVHDEGIGFRPEDRPRLFEKFFRAKSAVEKVPDGAGVALYIAKRIVELHGGKMWAESKGTGLGATFFFTIPDRGDKEEAAQVVPEEHESPKRASAAEVIAPPSPFTAETGTVALRDPLLGI